MVAWLEIAGNVVLMVLLLAFFFPRCCASLGLVDMVVFNVCPADELATVTLVDDSSRPFLHFAGTKSVSIDRFRSLNTVEAFEADIGCGD